MKNLVLGIVFIGITLFIGARAGIAQGDDEANLKKNLKAYTEDIDPKNANGSFHDLLKNPDEASGKKIVGKFFIKLRKYSDPNDPDNYTDEPVDETAAPTYLLYPKDQSKHSSKRYFQLFQGANDKKTFKNLAVGSTVTLYVLVMSGAMPFDEKHTITKLYFLSKTK